MPDQELDLRYWKRREFVIVQPDGSVVDWYPHMSTRQLFLMDVFRHLWGRRCEISPVLGALGRKLGRENTSQHNFDRWGEVRASDMFPTKAITRTDAKDIIDAAIKAGFTGIGIYPNWQDAHGLPSIGAHLDCRVGADVGNPAMWGGVDDEEGNQIYVSIAEALRRL